MISGCKGTEFGIINQISFENQKILLKCIISKAVYSKVGFKQPPKQNKTPKKDIRTLLQSVEHTYRAIDGIKRLLYGLEVAGEDTCQSPVQVG